MRKFTARAAKRKLTAKAARRKVYGDESNRQTYTAPVDDSWTIVGTPNTTLEQILGTLQENVIVR